MFKFIITLCLIILPVTLFAGGSSVVKSGDFVTVSYVLKVDGKVQETNNSFSFIIGAEQVIEGFESGMLGMRVGESKKIIVPPERGYGTGGTVRIVSLRDIAPVFTQDFDKKLFTDTIESTISRKELSKYADSEIIIGHTLIGSGGVKAQIMSIQGDQITLRIDNKTNPFYKKSRKVGTTVKKDGVVFKVIGENTNSYILQVTNTKSPFYKKPWKVGAIIKAPDGTTVKILKINVDTVEIEERSPMVGKTLTFDVKITSIQ